MHSLDHKVVFVTGVLQTDGYNLGEGSSERKKRNFGCLFHECLTEESAINS